MPDWFFFGWGLTLRLVYAYYVYVINQRTKRTNPGAAGKAPEAALSGAWSTNVNINDLIADACASTDAALDRAEASIARVEALMAGKPRPDVVQAAVRAGLLSGDSMRVPEEVCVTCGCDGYQCHRARRDRDAGHVIVRLTEQEWDAAQRRVVEDWPRRDEIIGRRVA